MPRKGLMSEQLTDAEREWVKRPLTDEERAATKGMPHAIVEGFIRRKRADEIVKRRRDDETTTTAEAAAEMFMAMAENLRTERP